VPEPLQTNLLLPVETTSREFDGKLLLALFAAERGMRPIIGGRGAMHNHLHELPRSVYFAKGARSGSRRVFRQLRAMGHDIVAADEEALVRNHDDMFLYKIDPETMRYVNLLIAWGQDNKEVWMRSPFTRKIPIAADGNPRIDMLRPELRQYHAVNTNAITKRYAPFVLFNTNFSAVNHFTPGKTRFRVADWVPAGRRDELKAGLVAHKQCIFDAFLSLIPKIADAIAPHTLIIRPHPSESPAPWMEAARDIGNVHVVQEGAIVPWLYAADLLLHNGCTTAVEAAMVGTPAISFQPAKSEFFDTELPNKLSRRVDSEVELLDALREVRTCRLPPPLSAAQKELLDHCAVGLGGRFCCERMLDSMGMVAKPATYEAMSATSRLSVIFSYHALRLSRIVSQGRRNGISRYKTHKFPDLDVASVNSRIDVLADTLGRFSHLRARDLMPNIFSIERTAT
jgi:surface carbohydrate biosynthesis protein